MKKRYISNLLKFDTIRGRIRFYVVLVVCIPSIIASLFFFFFQREHIVESAKTQIAEDLYSNKNTVKAYIDVCFEDVNFLIKIIQSHYLELEIASREFKNYIETHSDIASATFLGADGISIIDTTGVIGVYAGDRNYFTEAKAGRSAITIVQKGRVTGKPLCIFSAPVVDATGKFDGLVFLSIRLGELDAWMHGSFVPDIQGLMLCDAQGNVLAPASAVAAGRNDGSPARVSAHLLKLSESGEIFVNEAGARMVGAAVDVGKGGLKLIYYQSVDKILASYRWQTWSVILGALCAILFVMPFILRFCRSIEAPLEELTAYALELRKNDYAVTGRFCSHKNMPAEIRILFDAFTVMSFRVTRKIKDAEAQSLNDPLTGLHNRRFLQITGAEFFQNALTFGLQCSCLILDIDNFKKINDTYGHNIGDMVLQGVAKILNGSVRQADLLVRQGGEEFIVLATCTAAKQAEDLAQRIRQTVAGHSFALEGHTVNVTVSIGVAVSDSLNVAGQPASADDALLQLMIRADKALYAAKSSGRNAVIVAG